MTIVMGATGWYYATAYDEDIEFALGKLRHDTFIDGDYRRPWEVFSRSVTQALRGAPLGLRLIFAMAETFLFAAYFPRWAARGFRGPRSIEEALEDAAESGTHSILDITHLAEVREFAAAVPLSRRKLLDLFGTAEPSVEQVGTRLDDIQDDLQRWDAVYLTAFRDGKPDEILFIGCSGD